MDIDAVLQRSDIRAVAAVAQETEGMFVVLMRPEDSTVAWVSPGVTRLLGYESDELVGRSAWSLLHPQDAGRARRAGADMTAGGTTSGDYTVRHRDGHHVTMRRVAWLAGDVVVGLVVSPQSGMEVVPSPPE